MTTWYENYGADADGNRGVKTLFWELEDTEEEREEIAEILFEMGTESGSTGMTEITYEGIDIDVDTSDYTEELTQLELKDDIAEVAEMGFDKIVYIFKSEDKYKPQNKSLAVVLDDLKHNGYIACPF